ncbi:MAG: lipopolysaccharide transport periplasmic protein LptA [Moraxellaceae bacterium]|nr:MAG: lipopolysaccharide transport periplasmic protein LptA [Moraxellaceae bacterium]
MIASNYSLTLRALMNPSQSFQFKWLHLNRLISVAICAAFFDVAFVSALPSDKEQEIHILAKTASASQKDGVVTYSGDVKLTQGTLEITADKITLRTNSKQKVETIVAEGSPARYQQQPDEKKAIIHAEALNINYSVAKDYITLDKNAYIEQNGATTKGGRVEYDISSGTVKASGQGDQSGRVEFVIPPQVDKKE